TMAINELDSRRKRLEEYQIKARFALAESYDRAMKAEIDDEIKRQLKIQEALKESQTKTTAEDDATDKPSSSGDKPTAQ
ncbi:MAG: hypothetical protein KAU21_08670, partial [Gammaproteobacteria bacterium]|nr:hypothetical protein [Gammaproteobacteria bacterium]